MEQPLSSNESKLQKAAEFLSTGQKKDARLLIRDVLAAEANNLPAWELLYQASYNANEQIFCLERLLKLQSNHPWAKQQLERVRTSASTKMGMGESYLGQYPRKVSAFQKTQKKKRREPLLLWATILFSCLGIVCLGSWGLAIYRIGFLPLYSNNQTATAYAANQAGCQALIDQAMEASGQYCGQIGPNRVCYGNNKVKADLVPNASQRFSERGDVVNIAQLQRLSASPLDINNSEWGIAVFKVQANLPRSLPGETIKMMVFGNTSLDKNSENLQSFYFSSEPGQIVCKKLPFDGLMVTMPDGTGVKFIVNGAEMTLMGNASFKATKGKKMEVSLFSGSARIVSNGQEQYFGAGQKVDVKLGGANGTEAVGPPSAPQPLSPEEIIIACTMTGKTCSKNEITPVSGVQSTLGITSTPTNTPRKTSTGTATITRTASATPSKTRTSTITATITKTLTRTRTKTPLVSPTRTFTPKPFTPTKTLIPAITRTPTITLTITPGPSPTRTYTPTQTIMPTRTNTPTITLTVTHTLTPSTTLTVTETLTPTTTLTPLPPTVTETATTTLTPTITLVPLPTHTPTTTSTSPGHTATPIACTGGQVVAGALTTSADQLTITLQNNTGSPINIQQLNLNWTDTPASQKLLSVMLDSTTVAMKNLNNPPDSIMQGDWTITPTINSGASVTLLMQFSDPLTSPNEITVFFDINCHIKGNN